MALAHVPRNVPNPSSGINSQERLSFYFLFFFFFFFFFFWCPLPQCCVFTASSFVDFLSGREEGERKKLILGGRGSNVPA